MKTETKVIIHLTGDHNPQTKALDLDIAYGELVDKIPSNLLKRFPKESFPNAIMIFFPNGANVFGVERGEAIWDLVEDKTFCFDPDTNTDSILESILQKWYNKKPSLIKIDDVLEAWNRLSPQEKLEAYGNVDRYFLSKKDKYIHNLHKWLHGKYFKTDVIMRDEIIFGK